MPVSIKLLGAGVVVLVRVADHNWVAFAITGATAAIAYRMRFSPLWMFGVAALLGLAGFV